MLLTLLISHNDTFSTMVYDWNGCENSRWLKNYGWTLQKSAFACKMSASETLWQSENRSGGGAMSGMWATIAFTFALGIELYTWKTPQATRYVVAFVLARVGPSGLIWKGNERPNVFITGKFEETNYKSLITSPVRKYKLIKSICNIISI